MLVLALDTAGAATQSCLLDAGADRVLAEASRAMASGHAEALLPMIEDVLAKAGRDYADIARIAVTVGPGSFTGVRIALSAARAMGLALEKPVIGVSTLEALGAEGGDGRDPVIAAIDARRDEIYAQIFAADGTAMTSPMVAAAGIVADLAPAGPVRVIGSGAPTLAAERALFRQVGAAAVPAIATIARLAAMKPIPGAPPSPLYLRGPDAKPQGAALAKRA